MRYKESFEGLTDDMRKKAAGRSPCSSSSDAITTDREYPSMSVWSMDT